MKVNNGKSTAHHDNELIKKWTAYRRTIRMQRVTRQTVFKVTRKEKDHHTPSKSSQYDTNRTPKRSNRTEHYITHEIYQQTNMNITTEATDDDGYAQVAKRNASRPKTPPPIEPVTLTHQNAFSVLADPEEPKHETAATITATNLPKTPPTNTISTKPTRPAANSPAKTSKTPTLPKRMYARKTTPPNPPRTMTKSLPMTHRATRLTDNTTPDLEVHHKDSFITKKEIPTHLWNVHVYTTRPYHDQTPEQIIQRVLTAYQQHDKNTVLLPINTKTMDPLLQITVHDKPVTNSTQYYKIINKNKNWNLQIAMASNHKFTTATNHKPTSTLLTKPWVIRCREITFESNDTLAKAGFFLMHIPRIDGLLDLQQEIGLKTSTTIPLQAANEFFLTTNSKGRRVYAKHTVILCKPDHANELGQLLEKHFNTPHRTFIAHTTWTDKTSIKQKTELKKQHYTFVRNNTSNYINNLVDIDVPIPTRSGFESTIYDIIKRAQTPEGTRLFPHIGIAINNRVETYSPNTYATLARNWIRALPEKLKAEFQPSPLAEIFLSSSNDNTAANNSTATSDQNTSLNTSSQTPNSDSSLHSAQPHTHAIDTSHENPTTDQHPQTLEQLLKRLENIERAQQTNDEPKPNQRRFKSGDSSSTLTIEQIIEKATKQILKQVQHTIQDHPEVITINRKISTLEQQKSKLDELANTQKDIRITTWENQAAIIKIKKGLNAQITEKINKKAEEIEAEITLHTDMQIQSRMEHYAAEIAEQRAQADHISRTTIQEEFRNFHRASRRERKHKTSSKTSSNSSKTTATPPSPSNSSVSTVITIGSSSTAPEIDIDDSSDPSIVKSNNTTEIIELLSSTDTPSTENKNSPSTTKKNTQSPSPSHDSIGTLSGHSGDHMHPSPTARANHIENLRKYSPFYKIGEEKTSESNHKTTKRITRSERVKLHQTMYQAASTPPKTSPTHTADNLNTESTPPAKEQKGAEQS